ncbi:mitochondrial enolase superfamily member 1-like isoform X2 [Temnothorax americanus]|uniref:mitochondrial enolase superfamily member 1-like isoform X2 n=1 Tax=Temnothorax americanus TaxID=1964332 RepID=UPI004068D265
MYSERGGKDVFSRTLYSESRYYYRQFFSSVLQVKVAARYRKMSPKITNIVVYDVRFPTSVRHEGSSDSMLDRVDHSCTYVILDTVGDTDDTTKHKADDTTKHEADDTTKHKADDTTKHKGYGIAATLGRGNEFVVQTCKLMFELQVKNRTTEEIYSNFAKFWRELTTDMELRWLGPECGVVHLATAAIVNALWDLWARIEGKPVWKLLADMPPEQLVSTVDFRYITDVVTKEEAIQMLKENQDKEKKEKTLRSEGYPTYTSDVGRYTLRKQQVRSACSKFKKLDFTNFKTIVGPKVPESLYRCNVIRRVVGGKVKLMVDASQICESANEAITVVKGINETRPYCIEEPTSADDVLGHKAILNELRKLESEVRVTCGETCANRVMFKQFLKIGDTDFWSVNVGRLGGVNEALAVYFMARKHNKPVWGHAGGVGLGEMIQHLQIWNHICLGARTDTDTDGMIEFVSHQHGYFVDPVFIRNAHYLLPERPGFSTQLKNKCIARWSYPEGTRWKFIIQKKKEKKIIKKEKPKQKKKKRT